ncbi:MAG: hypothetical protein M4D80_25785 [Myxococcota bacterium]|nr:hypothetical protein [Deltaproteobacteria bacterium]MDQ3338590.1 hypothetical protein [Myxococcota bacterium]
MQVNIGYAYGQLVRAREKGDAKGVAKWQAVVDGMRSGSIKVGSRTPTKAPAWVTLDVVTGGFATGTYAASGSLRDHERVLAPTRGAANLAFLESSDADAMLASGHYRIDVPEEGALLVVAWLRQRRETARAAEIVETISPWIETLRFFPAPSTRAVEMRETVRVQDLGKTLDGLAEERDQPRVSAMRDAELVWKPLRDRAMALWIETVDGDVPRVVDGGISGGSVARVFPSGWRAWVHALVADCRAAKAEKTKRAYETIALVEHLARVATHPNALDERALGSLRAQIARFVTAHGVPGTQAFITRRVAEAAAVASPLHVDLRRVLVERLQHEPREGGIDIERAAAPVAHDEASRHAVPQGSALPWYMIAKLRRSWDAPLETLVEHDVIPSAEELARVLPQLTAHVRAQAIPDASGRRLYAAMYMAFRRRRGLLLLDYQHQIRFHELPWVAAMENARSTDAAQAARARKVVARASATALRAFPYTITPNKLVTELASLAAAAKLEMPLVEELAADIFMGSFTTKFLDAAKISSRLLEGTLYQRYFSIDARGLLKMKATGKTADQLAALCQQRAGISGSGYGVARNGKVIEQSQILTTHNLGVLFDRLALRDSFAPNLRAAAEECFRWIVRQLRMPGSHYETLVRLKNAAYAWRQMVFYLSFVRDVADFIAWARARLARSDVAFRTRFEPAMCGLELAAAGTWSTSPAFAAGGGRVFTGWSTERHWLAPP